ncbi:hypothetical protein GUJ93_ZPchr0004g38295 [Zizania palustris]|uniref:Uncharacterized protein n=1 Tax=Zizania palustris TaxID=103762 RepID=A0A8J5SQC8_ZIZPA|nr:hypothetical protein GUJ93_ZPchr0004g38295 [Zizania palustris]
MGLNPQSSPSPAQSSLEPLTSGTQVSVPPSASLSRRARLGASEGIGWSHPGHYKDRSAGSVAKHFRTNHKSNVYSMFNGVIDSRAVRAQKSAQSSQSSVGVGSSRRRSEENPEVVRLREEMRRRDEHSRQQQEYYTACLAQQQAMIQRLFVNYMVEMVEVWSYKYSPQMNKPGL